MYGKTGENVYERSVVTITMRVGPNDILTCSFALSNARVGLAVKAPHESLPRARVRMPVDLIYSTLFFPSLALTLSFSHSSIFPSSTSLIYYFFSLLFLLSFLCATPSHPWPFDWWTHADWEYWWVWNYKGIHAWISIKRNRIFHSQLSVHYMPLIRFPLFLSFSLYVLYLKYIERLFMRNYIQLCIHLGFISINLQLLFSLALCFYFFFPFCPLLFFNTPTHIFPIIASILFTSLLLSFRW